MSSLQGLALLILSVSLGQPASAYEFAALYARNTSYIPTPTTTFPSSISPPPNCPTYICSSCPTGAVRTTITQSNGCLFPCGC